MVAATTEIQNLNTTENRIILSYHRIINNSELSWEQRRVCDFSSSTQGLIEDKIFAITALPQLQPEQLSVQKLG